MRGELSHGLPELFTSGNRICRVDTTEPILLRGVNRSGLEYTEPTSAGFLPAADFTEEEVSEIVRNWRCNVARIPFNQDWALHGRRGHSAEEYLASLDWVISWFAAIGAYTILDLHWLDADTIYGHTHDENGVEVDNHVAPTPNAGTIPLWTALAARYCDEPAVIFDLFNEPHDRLTDDYLPIQVIASDGSVVESEDGSVGPRKWTAWASRLVAEVRAINPACLILVGGVSWAFDLHKIRIAAPNIVYSTHIYHDRPEDTWGKAFGHAAEVPVFVGEWGGTKDNLDFGARLAWLLRGEGLGWAAWSWVDYPQLIQPPRAPAFRPTLFGELVRGELSR
jgi:hypothetical protein